MTGIIVPKSNVHPDFDDPRGDVILEDRDGLLYQVSGHMLGKKCAFSRDMVKGATPSAVPFETQSSRKSLERFLGYALCAPDKRVEGAWSHLCAFQKHAPESLPVHLETYQFARKLDCDFVPELRSRLVSSFGHYQRIPLFRFASKLEDIELFRAVLQPLRMGELMKIGIWNIVNAIRHDWQVAFLRCCISTTGHTYIEDPDYPDPIVSSVFSLALKSSGREMADNFKPEHAHLDPGDTSPASMPPDLAAEPNVSRWDATEEWCPQLDREEMERREQWGAESW